MTDKFASHWTKSDDAMVEHALRHPLNIHEPHARVLAEPPADRGLACPLRPDQDKEPRPPSHQSTGSMRIQFSIVYWSVCPISIVTLPSFTSTMTLETK